MLSGFPDGDGDLNTEVGLEGQRLLSRAALSLSHAGEQPAGGFGGGCPRADGPGPPG